MSNFHWAQAGFSNALQDIAYSVSPSLTMVRYVLIHTILQPYLWKTEASLLFFRTAPCFLTSTHTKISCMDFATTPIFPLPITKSVCCLKLNIVPQRGLFVLYAQCGSVPLSFQFVWGRIKGTCFNTVPFKAIPHKARLTALHIICLHIFRHISQKAS